MNLRCIFLNCIQRIKYGWQRFILYIDQFKSIAMPQAVASDTQARAAYEKSVQASLAPVVDAARSAFTSCIEHATRFRIDTGETRACQAWIDKNAR